MENCDSIDGFFDFLKIEFKFSTKHPFWDHFRPKNEQKFGVRDYIFYSKRFSTYINNNHKLKGCDKCRPKICELNRFNALLCAVLRILMSYTNRKKEIINCTPAKSMSRRIWPLIKTKTKKKSIPFESRTQFDSTATRTIHKCHQCYFGETLKQSLEKFDWHS